MYPLPPVHEQAMRPFMRTEVEKNPYARTLVKPANRTHFKGASQRHDRRLILPLPEVLAAFQTASKKCPDGDWNMTVAPACRM
jgi:hypothetical protein